MIASYRAETLKARKRWAIRKLDETVRNFIRDRRATGEDRGDLLSVLLLAIAEEGDGKGLSDEQARPVHDPLPRRPRLWLTKTMASPRCAWTATRTKRSR